MAKDAEDVVEAINEDDPKHHPLNFDLPASGWTTPQRATRLEPHGDLVRAVFDCPSLANVTIVGYKVWRGHPGDYTTSTDPDDVPARDVLLHRTEITVKASVGGTISSDDVNLVLTQGRVTYAGEVWCAVESETATGTQAGATLTLHGG